MVTQTKRIRDYTRDTVSDTPTGWVARLGDPDHPFGWQYLTPGIVRRQVTVNKANAVSSIVGTWSPAPLTGSLLIVAAFFSEETTAVQDGSWSISGTNWRRFNDETWPFGPSTPSASTYLATHVAQAGEPGTVTLTWGAGVRDAIIVLIEYTGLPDDLPHRGPYGRTTGGVSSTINAATEPTFSPELDSYSLHLIVAANRRNEAQSNPTNGFKQIWTDATSGTNSVRGGLYQKILSTKDATDPLTMSITIATARKWSAMYCVFHVQPRRFEIDPTGVVFAETLVVDNGGRGTVPLRILGEFLDGTVNALEVAADAVSPTRSFAIKRDGTILFGVYAGQAGSVAIEPLATRGIRLDWIFDDDGVFQEMPAIPTAPAAGVAGDGRFFFLDNGAGKLQLCVRFPTGAVIVVAKEP